MFIHIDQYLLQIKYLNYLFEQNCSFSEISGTVLNLNAKNAEKT